MAGAESDALVEDFYNALHDAMTKGTGLKAFQASFDEIVAKHGWSYNGSAGLSVERFNRDIDIISQRLDKVFIEQLDWHDCIQRYDSKDTLVYCDPPYFDTTDYGIDFGMGQYVKMAELARTMKGKVIVSVNDIPVMRKVFDGLTIDQLSIKYSRGLAESGGTRKESFELLIRNF